MQRHKEPGSINLQTILEKKTEGFLAPLEKFMQKQVVASIFLFGAIILALLSANLPYTDAIKGFSEIEMGFVFHHNKLLMPMKEWISSGLMALFFFLIGLGRDDCSSLYLLVFYQTNARCPEWLGYSYGNRYGFCN